MSLIYVLIFQVLILTLLAEMGQHTDTERLSAGDDAARLYGSFGR